MKILIDNGHGTPVRNGGKHSPDKRLLEPVWCREFAAMLAARLAELDLDTELVVPETGDISIGERVSRVNAWCDRLGSKNVVLISIHNNAASSDGKWHDAHGWQVYVSKSASNNSKRLASLMTAEADRRGLVNPKSRQPNGYWTWSWRDDDIALLTRTKCPAVLTENLFQDNLSDVDFLLSEEGKRTLLDVHVDAVLKYVCGK